MTFPVPIPGIPEPAAPGLNTRTPGTSEEVWAFLNGSTHPSSPKARSGHVLRAALDAAAVAHNGIRYKAGGCWALVVPVPDVGEVWISDRDANLDGPPQLHDGWCAYLYTSDRPAEEGEGIEVYDSHDPLCGPDSRNCAEAVAAFLASAPTGPGASVATGGRVADAVLAAAMRAAISDGTCSVSCLSDGFEIVDRDDTVLYSSTRVFPDGDDLARYLGTPEPDPHAYRR